jgi:hypothetical protein
VTVIGKSSRNCTPSGCSIYVAIIAPKLRSFPAMLLSWRHTDDPFTITAISNCLGAVFRRDAVIHCDPCVTFTVAVADASVNTTEAFCEYTDQSRTLNANDNGDRMAGALGDGVGVGVGRLDCEMEPVDVPVAVGVTEAVTETDGVKLTDEVVDMVGVGDGDGVMLTIAISLVLLPTITAPSAAITGELLISLPIDRLHNTCPVAPSTLTTLPLPTPTYKRLLMSRPPPHRSSALKDNDQIGDPVMTSKAYKLPSRLPMKTVLSDIDTHGVAVTGPPVKKDHSRLPDVEFRAFMKPSPDPTYTTPRNTVGVLTPPPEGYSHTRLPEVALTATATFKDEQPTYTMELSSLMAGVDCTAPDVMNSQIIAPVSPLKACNFKLLPMYTRPSTPTVGDDPNSCGNDTCHISDPVPPFKAYNTRFTAVNTMPFTPTAGEEKKDGDDTAAANDHRTLPVATSTAETELLPPQKYPTPLLLIATDDASVVDPPAATDHFTPTTVTGPAGPE